MISLEDALKAVDLNVNIADIKEEIKDLVTIFNSEYPNVDLSNFARKIMDLKVEKASKLTNSKPVFYNFNTNVLSFNVDENDDLENLLMHGIINVIASNDIQTGFDYNNKFTALNEGFTQMVTNHLVGNYSENNYFEEELISTNLICHMVDVSVLEEAYFTNNSMNLASILMNQGVALEALDLLNYRYNNPDYNLEIDSRFAKSFFNTSRSEEEINSFMLWGSCSKEAEKINSLFLEKQNGNEVKGISRTA